MSNILHDGDGVTRATVTALYDAPGTSYRACQKCVHYSDNENHLPDVCATCSQAFGDATEDHWEKAESATSESCDACAHLDALTCFDPANDDAPEPCWECSGIPWPQGIADEDKQNLWQPLTEERATLQRTWLRRDTLRRSLPLSEEDKLLCGKEMADALHRIEELKSELDDQRKTYKKLIETQESIANEAAKQFTEGLGPEQDITCDVFQDWLTNEIVFVAAESPYLELLRRPMTPEEMQPTLLESSPEKTLPFEGGDGETIGTPHATNRHTCLDCGHMTDGENDTQAEECASCSQSGSGETDNWTPRRECRTCAHSNNTIDIPPCKGCTLNVMENHRGDADRWEWADAAME